MKKFITLALIPISMLFIASYGNNQINTKNDNAQQTSEIRHQKHKQLRIKMNKLIDERLNLTESQKAEIELCRKEHRQNMSGIIKQMQETRDEIKKIHETEPNKMQADIKSAPKKAELIALRKEAQKLREQHREKFKSILDDKQKIEFEKIKKEVYSKNP